MKIYWNVKELKEQLSEYRDSDNIVINIHEGTFYEDNYLFSVDKIRVNDENDEIWLSPIKNKTT